MTSRLTHRQLEYLVAVGEAGHFGAAAKICNVSQPALSTQIQLLEDRLNVKLIDRAPAGAQLTPVGETVVDLARQILSTLKEIENVAHYAGENLGGLIRLGVVATFGPYFLPAVLPRLQSHYPGLELHIQEAPPPDLEQAVLDGSIDCALSRPPSQHLSLCYRGLIEEELLLGIPNTHPLAKQRSIRPEMLKGERMLTLGTAHGMNPKIRAFCASTGAELYEDYEGTSLDMVRLMVSIGMGLFLFPELYIASEFAKEPRVVLRKLEGASVTRPIGLIWRDGSVRGPQYERLLEECKAALAAIRGA